MSDVFLSYKAEDRERVRPLVAALEAEGLTVWWDAHIEAGAAWRQTIQTELDAARCVVVAWSSRSVGSEGHFVQDEATRAQRRGVYLPVRIDAVEPPLGFGGTQALPLMGWKGDGADPRFQALAEAARAVAEGRLRTTAPASADPKPVDRRLLIGGGAAAAALVAAAGGWLALRPGAKAASDSIAVLPFANLSGDPAQAYFADGMAEELRAALARVVRLKVVARTSSEKMRDTAAPEAARKLGVARILTGSVRRSPELIRVSAQLVNGQDGLELWSRSYDQPAGDALKIQTGIAESVAQALKIELAPEEKEALASHGGTRSAAAQDAYMKAQAVYRAGGFDGEQGLRKTLAYLNEALRLDPSYVAAHAMRSNTLYSLSNDYEAGAQARADLAEAMAAAQRAVQIDPRSALAQSALAFALQHYMDMAGALKRHQIAYQLAPNDPDVAANYAFTLAYAGRAAEGLPLIDKAIAGDPLDPRKRTRKAVVLLYARRYAEALAESQEVVRTLGRSDYAHNTAGDALIMLGRAGEAAKEYAQNSSPWGRPTGLAMARALAGDKAGSDAALAELVRMDDGSINYQFAEVYAQRGEIDRAFASLEKAFQAGDTGLNILRADPLLDPLRGDPRFPPLLKRLKYD